MSREVPQKSTHRDFFRFQMKINEILSDYDIPELELFYRTSKNGFPHMSTLIKELIYLAKKGVESGELPETERTMDYNMPIIPTLGMPTARNTSILTEESRKARLLEYRNALESRIIFPTNQDLGEFSIASVGIDAGWRWDSRENIVRKIWDHIMHLPVAKRERILRIIQDIAARNNIFLSTPNDDSFFTSWERIIRDRGRSGND